MSKTINISDKSSVTILNGRLRNTYRILNHRGLMERKIQAYNQNKFVHEIGVIELHPTDRCDLQCFYCTYGSNNRMHTNNSTVQDFPYEMLEKVNRVNPKAIVFAGGGEPLIYNYKGKTFEDIVYYFKKSLPDTKLGLITNGTKIPSQDCIKELDWVRVSVDALDKDTFSALKGGVFEKRLQTIFQYALSPVQNIGIGFLYNRFNYKQIPYFIKEIYDIVMGELGEDYLRKINIQFRPTCPIESCMCPSDNYRDAILMTPDKQEWWKEMSQYIITTIKTLSKYKKMERFVREQTNVYEITKEKKEHSLDFNHCYVAMLRWTIRANGDIYPCVIKASNQNAIMGNLFTSSLKELFSMEQKIYTLQPEYCTGPDECCRIGGVSNEIAEKHRLTDLSVETDDYFF
ncbi:radical SAM protein [Ruminiclostridium cellobioparum]|uniref:Putative Fe-S oxidoreductase n=1 Tax=Ruminiclostridium cellobioparum subsp. termitidis CT1112 TaxID=1195236 RepID=S0FNQ5_RUMCE|nr:radical SAM/SPASM domain-containing protein [Ruminiclostridium cellobioparum]EMS72001.1 putative Fe-S oxidoreductase [Ruminiclostridium cellobioparum subsp. termitidis CT1112]